MPSRVILTQTYPNLTQYTKQIYFLTLSYCSTLPTHTHRHKQTTKWKISEFQILNQNELQSSEPLWIWRITAWGSTFSSWTSQDPEQVKYNFKLLYLSKHAGTIVDWWQENNKALSCFQKKGCICPWITLLVCYNIINTKSLFYWKSQKKCYRPCSSFSSSFKFISVFLKKSYKTALPANIRVNLAR